MTEVIGVNNQLKANDSWLQEGDPFCLDEEIKLVLFKGIDCDGL
ncbi:hypothetical protein NYQ66_02640 [Aquibacillus koreensis]|nr:hypothetical protein [Aquibacillus koreensis]MCT2534676.1 hypothetical protein [Aquibacillus koreensis]